MMKTKKSAAKRIKITARGKVKHWSPGKSHLNRKKNRKKLRRLKKAKILTGQQAHNYKVLVPYM